jgi:hypothetical protein
VTAEQPAFPARMGYGVYALSSGTGVLAPVGRALVEHDGLDVSTGTSGPHDLAVRVGAARQSALRVHRIPPRVRDDRDPPLMVRRDGRKHRPDLPDETRPPGVRHGNATGSHTAGHTPADAIKAKQSRKMPAASGDDDQCRMQAIVSVSGGKHDPWQLPAVV